MATIINFTPTPFANFQFQATLDGSSYTVIVTWNIYGERYYVSIYTLTNKLVLSIPLIGSPLEYDISLTAGYFSTKLIFREPKQQFEII